MHDLTHSVEFQMSLLLVVALGGYMLSTRLRQPAVVGVILAGIPFGPSLLDWISYTDFVEQMAQLGAIMLLFVTGMHFKFRALTHPSYALIALCGVILPWAGGYGFAILMGYDNPAAMLIGVALTATSIAITADTLRELGKLNTDVAQAIVSAAVMDDVLALMALGLVGQMDAPGGLNFTALGQMLVWFILFLAAAAIFARHVLTHLIDWIDRSTLSTRFPEVGLIFAVMIAFFYAMGASLAGLSPVVGAFIAGVSFEGVTSRFSKEFRGGADHLRIIFGAIFFASIGILADFRELDSAHILFVVGLILVALLTKIIGAALPAWGIGFSYHRALAVGIGMAPRGEVAMIVGLMGLESGLLDQPAYLAIVSTIVVTSLVVPVTLKSEFYHSQPSTHPDERITHNGDNDNDNKDVS